jgi:N-acetylmuramoyl-L-alanine amidase
MAAGGVTTAGTRPAARRTRTLAVLMLLTLLGAPQGPVLGAETAEGPEATSAPKLEPAPPDAPPDPVAAPPGEPAAGSCKRDAFLLVVDVGHTPEAVGARSATGRGEYEFNLALSKRIVAEARRAGFARTQLMLTRGIGRPQLEARARRATALGADLFVSIHHDSVQDEFLRTWTAGGRTLTYSDHAAGHSLFVSLANARPEASLAAARLIGERLRAAGLKPTAHHAADIPGERRPLLDTERGVHRYDDLVVLRQNGVPAVLVEAGVIVNRAEERRVATTWFRTCFARAVAAAVADYCDGVEPAAEPAPVAAKLCDGPAPASPAEPGGMEPEAGEDAPDP